MASKITYQQAGVSIDANDEMVGCIRKSVHSTYGPRVMVLENGFAGLFRLDYDEKLFKKNYKNPVLVACTDDARWSSVAHRRRRAPRRLRAGERRTGGCGPRRGLGRGGGT